MKKVLATTAAVFECQLTFSRLSDEGDMRRQSSRMSSLIPAPPLLLEIEVMYAAMLSQKQEAFQEGCPQY